MKNQRDKTSQKRKPKITKHIPEISLERYENTDFRGPFEAMFFAGEKPLDETNEVMTPTSLDLEVWVGDIISIGLLPGTDEYNAAMKRHFNTFIGLDLPIELLNAAIKIEKHQLWLMNYKPGSDEFNYAMRVFIKDVLR